MRVQLVVRPSPTAELFGGVRSHPKDQTEVLHETSRLPCPLPPLLQPLSVTFAVALPAAAQVRQFKEGKDYRKSSPRPAPAEAPAGEVGFIEFFWYSCPLQFVRACARRLIKAAPKGSRSPSRASGVQRQLRAQQKLYYALEGMGKLDAVHAKVFRAIHVEKLKLAKDDDVCLGGQPGRGCRPSSRRS